MARFQARARLKFETVLVALNPKLKQIDFLHCTAPFRGIGALEALVEDESVAVDARTRVQVADDQVFLYGTDEAALGRIDNPGRPLQLRVGDAKGRSVYVPAHHAVDRVGLAD